MSQKPDNKDGAKGGRKSYVRVITDKRREQNRRSQKAYRERQKKRLEGLEELEEQIKAKTPQELSWPEANCLEEDGLPQEVQAQGRLHYNPSDSSASVIDLGAAFEMGGDLAVPADSSLPLVNIAIRPRTPSQTTPRSGSSQ